ncbi:biphenyl 2,3-dioxygenase [Veronia nyctiphanis]|uniref:Biphenyl 2,3-dioxygenase n=1 Tax=Veronia nyctiphanis TaxID=1278244 RepID=A0A4Q0YSA0_9GAMM|nr:GNAT family N-acetyltransferase [Veronia nyctiphanis]RXJ74072.1 biphenyl 2,3-dioxygenase [Veronia nyctiphanis]
MKLDVIYDPTEDDIAKVTTGLRSYNLPFLEHIPSETFVCLLKEQNIVLAGCVARLFGQWIKIEYVWVDDASRGKGIGGKLLEELENVGRQKGCKRALVDTLSFQALPFYQKQGYVKQMSLEDYPVDDMQLHFLTKSLV